MTREFDVLLLGATGFTGRLVAEYLATHAPPSARIGLVGRNAEKLKQIQAQLPAQAHTWPVLVADSLQASDMDRIAQKTRVVATTVGPYARYGIPLVAACASHGTHYCDLTGETTFMRQCIDQFDARAQESGAKIVPTCGFDSIPSDLGVGFLAKNLPDLERATYVVESMRGGFSGGTVASMMQLMEDLVAHPEYRKLLADPYALSARPKEEARHLKQRDVASFYYDDFVGQWVAPFVMAPVNTRVVRRTSSLLGFAYGREFRYQEVSGFRTGISGASMAAGMTLGMGLFMSLAAFKPGRTILGRFLPAPGEGPSENERKNGKIRIRIYGQTSGNKRGSVLIEGDGDPGYHLTSGMLGESALCLAFDELPNRSGLLTPQSAMGDALLSRLNKGWLRFSFSGSIGFFV